MISLYIILYIPLSKSYKLFIKYIVNNETVHNCPCVNKVYCLVFATGLLKDLHQ